MYWHHILTIQHGNIINLRGVKFHRIFVHWASVHSASRCERIRNVTEGISALRFVTLVIFL